MTAMERMRTPREEQPRAREVEASKVINAQAQNDAIALERLMTALDPDVRAVLHQATTSLREAQQVLDDTRLALASHEAVQPLRYAELHAWEVERQSLLVAIAGYEKALARAQRAHAEAYGETITHAVSVVREQLRAADHDREVDMNEYQRMIKEAKAFTYAAAERRDMVARLYSRLVDGRDPDPLNVLGGGQDGTN